MTLFKSDKIKGIFQLILVVGFVLFSFIFSALLKSKKSDSAFNNAQSKDLFVKVANIKAQNKRLELNLTGVFKARSQVDIIPQISGRVVKIDDNFFNGGTFEAQKTVFEIDPQDYILEVKRLEAEVKKAETAYDLQRVEAKAALAEWYQLHPSKKKAPELVQRKPQLREAKANLLAAQSMLQNAKLDLQRTKYSLPFTGRVLNSSVAKGQYLNAAQSYGQVYDASLMEIESAISDDEAKIFAESGEDIEIKIKTKYLGKSYNYDGILKRAFSEYEPQTRFGRIIFGIKGSCSMKLFPGIFAKVRVLGREIKDVLVLPISSLQNGNKIWMVDKDNKLKLLSGEILFSDDEKIYFKSELKAAKIVVGKISGAFEKMPVRFDDKEDNGKK